jgi:outer membrane protein assembly factor BamB
LPTTKVGWSETDSNGADSRANPAEKVLTPAAVKRVKYLRSVTAPQTPPHAPCGPGYVAAPLLYGGFLYAITSGQVSKYNPATGRLIWRVKLANDHTYGALAISGNLVIVGGSDCESESTPAGLVYAINATTGAHVWTFGPNTDVPTYDMVQVGSYVITAGDNANGDVVAVLNESNGKLVWAENDSACDNSPAPPALVVHMLVMWYGCDSQGNETLEASDLATGAVAWSLTGNWEFQRADSDTFGKHLYVTDPSGTVEDLNPLTGQVQYPLSQAVQVLAVDTSRVYALCGSIGAYAVCAYNISTGTLEWRYPQFASLAAEAGGVLYLNSGIALNAATGTVIKRLAFSGATALAVGDGRIAASSESRVLDLFGLPGY